MTDLVDVTEVSTVLSQGMEVPAELAAEFKFARQRSKLAREIRGSFFVITGSADRSSARACGGLRRPARDGRRETERASVR